MEIKNKNSINPALPLIFIFAICILVFSGTVQAEELQTKSGAVLLMDAYSGEIVFARNEHEKLFPASITKIMTLLLALEELERGAVALEDEVPVSKQSSAMGGSTLFLSPGDVVDLESLLIGIAVGSGNDASVAVAEHIAGSEEGFAERMNQRAAELQMNNTHFVNCTGLHHAEHYTTAYDVALMSREIINFPQFFKWSKVWLDETFLEGKIKSGKVYLSNTNRLIHYYRNCDGIKTGFTNESGHSISASAKRDDTRFIAVVLNAPTSDTRYEEAVNLLNYGFANYYNIFLAGKNEKIDRLPIEKGCVKEVDVVTNDILSMLVKKGEEPQYTTEIVLPEKLSAPLPLAHKVGAMRILEGSKVLKEVDLEVTQEVQKASLLQLFRRYMDVWLKFGR